MTIIAFLRPLLLRGHRRLAELPPQHNYCIKTPLSVTVEGQDTSAREFRNRLATGPGFPDFLKRASAEKKDPQLPQADVEDTHSYFPEASLSGDGRKVYFETYGCQMNVSDTEIAWSILQRRGYLRTKDPSQADVILLVTCSVREKAEQTIWNKLRQLATLKQKRPKTQSPLKLGVLGCMAERLKTELLEREKLVDVLAGPDAYRDLPRLLSVAHGGLRASNVLLSLEETYADVMPVHRTPQGHSAFVSVMRGCDNMCSYCIVPFTRGRERSRPIASILEEVRLLLDQGVREVTLLGQNVNSYRDTSVQQLSGVEPTRRSRGFSALYRDRQGGLRFADLLDRVSLVDPEMRVRFTSPHPKDFPDEVLQLIQERGNICKQIHLPAQSGSSRVLQAMRRGYTREAYLELVAHIRGIIPEVSLSSDFIAGFCGETEEDHQQTVSLLRDVRYNMGFLFAYSMRQKTHASRRLQDDVPLEVKQRRLEELITVFREEASKVNAGLIGSAQLVLVEGESKRSATELCGRNEGNLKVIFPRQEVPTNPSSTCTAAISPGDYVLVKITSASSQSLRGIPLCHSTLSSTGTAVH
ncbi:mitochondrial tRNA methylthiotransferase CDK5RAP1 isoform X2 [Lepisosteus oculatus]|uniref:mitochondrial tRNA methylthiotransferase CDK5RAP1 isoform X2 n=1 Tax=Lepisosteus oculatus TaxID=7918 RepID=UPI0035F51D69